jgi:hypothetical protein
MIPTSDTTIDSPATPSTLSVSINSMSQLNLFWKDMASGESGYLVERCAGATCTNFAQVAQVEANATTYANTGLVKATTYRYRVRAFVSSGSVPYSTVSAYSNIASATTKSK